MAEKFATHEYTEIFYQEIQNLVTKNMTECKRVNKRGSLRHHAVDFSDGQEWERILQCQVFLFAGLHRAKNFYAVEKSTKIFLY